MRIKGKSYDKSINGSHVNVSSRDKIRVFLSGLSNGLEVSKHFEGSISITNAVVSYDVFMFQGEVSVIDFLSLNPLFVVTSSPSAAAEDGAHSQG